MTTIQGGTGGLTSGAWPGGWSRTALLGVAPGTSRPRRSSTSSAGVIQRDIFLVDAPKTTHNTYLQILAELGVVGLALFLAIIIYSLASVARAATIFSRI